MKPAPACPQASKDWFCISGLAAVTAGYGGVLLLTSDRGNIPLIAVVAVLGAAATLFVGIGVKKWLGAAK